VAQARKLVSWLLGLEMRVKEQLEMVTRAVAGLSLVARKIRP